MNAKPHPSSKPPGRAGHPPIKPRKMRFAFEEIAKADFYDDNPIITALLAALSAVFPPGEQEFVASVRNYLDQIDDPELVAEVRAFVAQESHHGLQHRRFNEAFDALGFDATRIEAITKRRIAKEIAVLPPHVRLAATASLEHITAVLAHYILTHPELHEPAPPAVAELLKWHAVEEIEHKAVAFDVYDRCIGDRANLRKVYRYITLLFFFETAVHTAMLLYWARKVPSLKDVGKTAKFLFGRRGMVTSTAKHYFAFLRKDFHPWDLDDRALIAQWQADHPEPEVLREAS